MLFAFDAVDDVDMDAEQPGVVVAYSRKQQSDFAHIIAAGGWRQVYLAR